MNPLDQLRIAAPCPMSWDAMKGNDRVRFCGACKLNVYDLSNLEERDTLDLLQRTEGRACVRLWRRKDGTVLTADCPVGTAERARRRLRGLAVACTLLMLTIMGGVAFAQTDTGRRLVKAVAGWFEKPAERPVMGAPVPVPPRAPQ